MALDAALAKSKAAFESDDSSDEGHQQDADLDVAEHCQERTRSKISPTQEPVRAAGIESTHPIQVAQDTASQAEPFPGANVNGLEFGRQVSDSRELSLSHQSVTISDRSVGEPKRMREVNLEFESAPKRIRLDTARE